MLQQIPDFSTLHLCAAAGTGSFCTTLQICGMAEVEWNRPVASVSERGDHKPTTVAQVLVPILQHGVDHPCHHLIVL